MAFTTPENCNRLRISLVNTSGNTDTIAFKWIQLELGSTATEYEPYHKYDVPVTVRGKNLLPNSDWMSGAHQNGFQEQVTKEYITEYTQNSISFNLAAWKGVSSPRFSKDSVKRIVFKINQTALNSDSYVNFYITIQGYDNDNNKTGNRVIYNNAIADTEYVFDFYTISSYSFYANSTQFSFCILARQNALSNLMVYDIAYYADTDTTEYEPYIGETKHIYLDKPLRKVGDYADYVDFKNQKVVRCIGEITLDGTENWVYQESSNMIYLSIKNKNLSRTFDSFSTHFLFSDSKNAIDPYFVVVNTSTLGNVVLRFNQQGDNIIYSTADEFKTFLVDQYNSGNPVKLLCNCYNVVETAVTIPNLTAPKSERATIMVDTSIKPSNMKIKYIRA